MSENYLCFFDTDLRLKAAEWAFYFDCLRIGTFEESYRKDCEKAISLILNSVEDKNFGAAVKYTDACSTVIVMDALKASGLTETTIFEVARALEKDLHGEVAYLEGIRDFYLAISNGSR